MRTLLKVFVIGLILAFAAFAIALQSEPVRNAVKKTLATEIAKNSGYKVSIGNLWISPSLRITAEDIDILDEEKKIARIGQAAMRVSARALLEGIIHVHHVKLEDVSSTALPGMPQVAVTFEGEATLNPGAGHASAHLFFHSPHADGKWTKGEATYANGTGDLELKTSDGCIFDAQYILTPDFLLRIPRFHASLKHFSFDGHVTMTKEGTITESALFLTSGDLSAIAPASGHLRGEGKILGTIKNPQFEVSLASDFIDVHKQRLEDIHFVIRSYAVDADNRGKCTLSFTKNAQKYRFEGNIEWENPYALLPATIATTADLAELADLLALDSTDITGSATLAITLSQTGASCRVKLEGGSIDCYQLGSVITNIQAEMEGDFNSLRLITLQASDGNGGTFHCNGTLAVDAEKGFPLDFLFHIEQASLIQLDNFKATASGQLQVTGTVNYPKVQGVIETESTTFKIPDKIPEVTDTLPVTYINQKPGEWIPTPYRVKRPAWPLELDLLIKIPKNGKIKSSNLNSDWKGEIKVTGTPSAPLFNGELQVDKGTYNTRGRKIQIHRGAITFAGDLEKKTTLYVIGEMEMGQTTVEAIVKGPIKNPTVALRSNPPMSQREILSLILFNKPASEISQFQGTQLNQSLLSLSEGSDSGPDILTRMSNSLGLDRFEISGSPGSTSGDMSLKVGKYVSEKTLISLSRNITQSANRETQANSVGIETRLNKYIKLQAEVDDDQNGQLNLIWRKDY